ncbi:IS66 family insertion sequence element accessory protein TnpB, partial [Escherichia coli]|uniref:IS66 family insertion sequence element accessory protein TnpB n=1 Tax=Escherichia coli TaxID=562 RepID=UPI00207C0DD5
LPSETMIWQPEFTDKTLSRKPGAVHLEEGQFIWPAVRDGKVSITRSQLVMLLDKLDWRQPKTSRLNSLTML